MPRLSKEERITTIEFDETSTPALVTTYNLNLKQYLAVLAVEFPKQVRQVGDEDPCGNIAYTVPKNWVHIDPTRVK